MESIRGEHRWVHCDVQLSGLPELGRAQCVPRPISADLLLHADDDSHLSARRNSFTGCQGSRERAEECYEWVRTKRDPRTTRRISSFLFAGTWKEGSSVVRGSFAGSSMRRRGESAWCSFTASTTVTVAPLKRISRSGNAKPRSLVLLTPLSLTTASATRSGRAMPIGRFSTGLISWFIRPRSTHR